MKSTYTLELTKEQIAYIRKAVGNQNIKRLVKAQECRRDGNNDGFDYQMSQREIGHMVLALIDEQM